MNTLQQVDFFFQSSQITELMLSVVKKVQGGFSFCGAAKVLLEDSTKGIQISEDAQEKNDNLR